jgi:hypothetical protein
MEMDNDFLSDAEFDLTPEQGALVNKAISIAASKRGDDFAEVNPLIAVLQWWLENTDESKRAGLTAESRLVEACKAYMAAHSD